MTESPTRFSRLLSGDVTSPLRANAGLRYVEFDLGLLVEDIDVPEWLAGNPMAALLILADSALAAAASTRLPTDHAPVTRRLSIDTVHMPTGAIPSMRATAEVVHLDRTTAVVHGQLRTDGTLLALAAMCVTIVADDGATDRSPAMRTHAGPIETTVVGPGVVRAHADASYGNSIGTLHGGVVAATTEQAMRQACNVPATEHLVVDYLLPIPADDQPFDVQCELFHRSGERAFTRAVVRRPDGRNAALAQAAHRTRL